MAASELEPANAEVLVAIVNHPRDLAIAFDQHWYRIPTRSVEEWLRRRWPPRWVAFYQPRVFGDEAFSVHYYSRVLEIRQVLRWELFPELLRDERASESYFQLVLGPIEHLRRPIPSRRWRRIVFIQTTWHKFSLADEINDLFDDSPLEDRLWAELKRAEVQAERQVFVTVNGNDYALDFAFYCKAGQLDVEADGDTWHSDPRRIPVDNRRDNDLETGGWKLLRFNTAHLNDHMTDYCLPTIIQNIHQLRGLE